MKKFWKTLTDSWWGNILLGFAAAVIFYYVVLVNVLSSSTPVVAVVSGSMYHGPSDGKQICGIAIDGFKQFDDYWKICGETYEEFGITKEQFASFNFKDGFGVGDMPVVKGEGTYMVGDIIVYSVQGINAPIIHRIVKINGDGTYQTKGDNNNGQNPYEYSVSPSQIKGKVIFIIPKIGYFKVLTTRLFGV
ncbi:MAG: hypothetical protein HYT70_02475 [Candidatus Aenigmarchaeota archaeon]|nr:hypothetical protein [Candidatus Aenigmarchaeota archaeon]